jgi:hypothetical protein
MFCPPESRGQKTYHFKNLTTDDGDERIPTDLAHPASFAHKFFVISLRAAAAALSVKKTQGFSTSPASRRCLEMTNLIFGRSSARHPNIYELPWA